MSNFLDDIKGFFDEFGESAGGKGPRIGQQENETAAGMTRVVTTIPVKELKPGGLRLFVMLYLMGEQNTPAPKSWRANQPSSDEYVVDFRFHDRTAALSVSLSDEHKHITIERLGSAPSNAYIMQESVIINGLLDALIELESANDVAEADRLLTLHEPRNAISKAKEELAFG